MDCTQKPGGFQQAVFCFSFDNQFLAASVVLPIIHASVFPMKRGVIIFLSFAMVLVCSIGHAQLILTNFTFDGDTLSTNITVSNPTIRPS